MNPIHIKDLAHYKGLGGPLVFAVDTHSIPEKKIVHFVRFETQHYENGETLDGTKFQVLNADVDDKRLHLLAQCFTARGEQVAKQLMASIAVMNEMLACEVKAPSPARKQVWQDVLAANRRLIFELSKGT